MGSILVGAVLLAVVAVAVASMARDKKNGKSISCGGDCSHCAGHCSPDQMQEKKTDQNIDQVTKQK